MLSLRNSDSISLRTVIILVFGLKNNQCLVYEIVIVLLLGLINSLFSLRNSDSTITK